MNKEQRKGYLGLTRIPLPDYEYPSLCGFCKYGWWHGDCEDAMLECRHPLNKRFELWEPFNVWEGNGADCWGFRPEVDIDEAADMVGIWLHGKTVEET